MKHTLQQLAELVGGTVAGDPTCEITGVTSIEDAGPDQLTFAVGKGHLEKAAASRAAAVIIPREVTDFSKPAILVDNPKAAFAQLLALFSPPPKVTPGIHPTCVLGKNVRLGQHVSLQAHVVVGDDVTLGDHVIIYPGAYIGDGAVIGDHTLIYPNVVIREGCRIGNNVIIHSGTVIGSDGFGYVNVDGCHRKVPQVGIVVIEDDVEVGANVAIDRATTGVTLVKRGTKIDNLVHLAHNVVVGEDCLIIAQVGIAGSTRIGNRVTLAGQAGVAGHLTIEDNAVFAAKSGVIGDVPANAFYAGFPARPHQEWLKAEAALRKLPELLKTIRDLERRLWALEHEDKALLARDE